MRIHRDCTHDFFQAIMTWECCGSVYMASACERESNLCSKLLFNLKKPELSTL